MIALYIIAFVLAVIGIIFVLKITPEQINKDITDLFGKEETLKDKSLSARGKKKKSKILLELEHLHRALKETGKEKQFSFACALSALLMIAGCVIAIAIDNVFLIPVLAVAFAILPFAYLHKAIAIYEERVKTELESALSLITSSYIRSENLVAAVEDSIFDAFSKKFFYIVKISKNHCRTRILAALKYRKNTESLCCSVNFPRKKVLYALPRQTPRQTDNGL